MTTSPASKRPDAKLSTEEVGTLVTELVPSEEERRPLLAVLAEAIRAAHDVSARSWELSIRDAERRLIRLNVGQAVVFTVEGESIDIAVPGDEELLDRIRNLVAGTDLREPKEFKVSPGVWYIQIPRSVFLDQLEELGPHQLEATRAAARTVVTRTSFWKHHQPGAVAYLEEQLGEELPEPDYDVAALHEIQEGPERLVAAVEFKYPDWQGFRDDRFVA